MINLIISSTTDPSFLVMFNKNKKFNINIPLWVKLYMFNMNYSFPGIALSSLWKGWISTPLLNKLWYHRIMWLCLEVWYLTPLSTICQLYRGCQLYWRENNRFVTW